MKPLCALRVKTLRPLREIETVNVTYEVLYNLLLVWSFTPRPRRKTAKKPQRWNDYLTPLRETPLRPSREKS